MGPVVLDPGQDGVGAAPHGREVLGQQYESQRQHPKAKDRKDAEDAADDQQQARGYAQPPRNWLSQPANRALEPLRKAPDQQFQPAFPIIFFLVLPRASGQCRVGRLALCMDTQKSGSFLHELRRTSRAGTVEMWGF
jgi:hypothetical protein